MVNMRNKYSVSWEALLCDHAVHPRAALGVIHDGGSDVFLGLKIKTFGILGGQETRYWMYF